MKVTDFKNGIVLFEYPTVKELGTAFVRMQEFYENPSKQFRGQYFKFKKFKAWYSKKFGKGKFTYFEDFEGFNLPGEVFCNFFCKYIRKGLHFDEARIFDGVRHYFWESEPFYIIGSVNGAQGTIDHELSHAFFHLFPSYKKAVLRLLKGHKFSDIKRYLLAHSYSPEVFHDEIAAYLMFDAAALESEGIDTSKYGQIAKDLHKVFKKHVVKHMPK